MLIHHDEPSGSALWAEVAELPGCFATGQDRDELEEALSEAVEMYLEHAEPSPAVDVEIGRYHLRGHRLVPAS